MPPLQDVSDRQWRQPVGCRGGGLRAALGEPSERDAFFLIKSILLMGLAVSTAGHWSLVMDFL